MITSLLFHISFFVVMTVAAVASFSVGLLLPLRRRVIITHLTARAMSWLLRVICGVRVLVEYVDKHAFDAGVAGGRSMLIVANHQSQWETFYFQSLFAPLINVLKRELILMPVLGWGLASYWPVILQRSHAIRAIKKVQNDGAARLASGFNLLIFPQATRLAVGEVGSISKGPAKLAVASGALMVPVVHDAGKHWRKRGFRIAAGTIRVLVGSPIDCTSLSTREVASRYEDFLKQQIELQIAE